MSARLRWHIEPENRQLTGELARELEIPRIVAHLLVVRGIDSPEAGYHFLNPSRDHASDPFLLDGMHAAVERLHRARDKGEHVLVFGDYDVDGIAGTALLVRALREFGIESCSHGMPDRLTEGYGLNEERVRWAKELGVRLIVTVDNGITARGAAAAAVELGIDLIVTDHHQPEGELPQALAVINPKLQEPTHPGADLCGAAVAFKLAWALTGEQTGLDLAALGTVADIVPLGTENRAIVALGLKEMARCARPGLVKLAEVAGVKLEALTARDISFQLAPRINAGGRLGTGMTGLELLLTDSPADAAVLADELDAANKERREIEAEIAAQALEELERGFSADQRSIVLARRDWHAGVIGIVASRLQSHYYRPIVLIAVDEDGVGHGSVRSIDSYDVASALASCREYLTKFGGHQAAAGLTINEEHIAPFAQAFEAHAARELSEDALRRPLRIDALVSFSEIDGRLVRCLDQMEPFGQANPAPVFCTYGAGMLANSLRELRGGHIKVALREQSHILQAIGFQMGETARAISDASSLNVAFTPQFNTWRGETTIQLVLKDIQPSDS